MRRESGVDAIAERVGEVRRRIAAAATRAGRAPEQVTLVAICKTHPVEAIRAAIGAGVTAFGENRVQEAVPKIEAIGRSPEWHLVGSLQTNKARPAIEHFDVVHSVDRLDLARAISASATSSGRRCRALVQVNVTGKPSQGGVAPDALDALVRAAAALPGLHLDGLMVIAPDATEAGGIEATRAAFRRVAARWRELAPTARDQGHAWHHLSMGMTGDFEVAIEEGATIVRVGRAIFGDRSS